MKRTDYYPTTNPMKDTNTLIVYGIKNCDTVKKALKWLDENRVPYTFHDFKSKGIDKKKLNDWVAQVGYDSLLNRKGMTWRKLTGEEQSAAASKAGAIALMMEKTSVIKRPVLEKEGSLLTLGFDATLYEDLFR